MHVYKQSRGFAWLQNLTTQSQIWQTWSINFNHNLNKWRHQWRNSTATNHTQDHGEKSLHVSIIQCWVNPNIVRMCWNNRTQMLSIILPDVFCRCSFGVPVRSEHSPPRLSSQPQHPPPPGCVRTVQLIMWPISGVVKVVLSGQPHARLHGGHFE